MGLQLRDCQNNPRHAQQHHLRHIPNLRHLLYPDGHLYSILVSPQPPLQHTPKDRY